MTRAVLLDASFLVELERETAQRVEGPARRFLRALGERPLVISVITVEEILEGAANEDAAFASLQRFVIQGLHLAQARRCALMQRRASRRMGENDAWLVATAQSLDADIVGADRDAFERLGRRYLRFR
jgi:predicted nucleic acid-binding protein